MTCAWSLVHLQPSQLFTWLCHILLDLKHGCTPCADFAIPSRRGGDGSLTGGVTPSPASAADLGGGRPRTLLAARANSQPSLGPQALERPASSSHLGSGLAWLGPQV